MGVGGVEWSVVAAVAAAAAIAAIAAAAAAAAVGSGQQAVGGRQWAGSEWAVGGGERRAWRVRPAADSS